MIPTIDLAGYTGVLLVVLLVAILGLLVYLRDPIHAAPHAVSRLVWCPRHERPVLVEFTERVETGMAFRQVRDCPLRRPGEQCGEGCVWKAALLP